MSFYVTLPSNASLMHLSSNTQSNYTTILKKPIYLDGDYEVAMTEINYPSNFISNYGSIEFPCFAREYSTKNSRAQFLKISLTMPNYLTKSQLVDWLNKGITDTALKEEYLHRYALAWKFNELMAKDLTTWTDDQKPIILVLKKKDNLEVCDLSSTFIRKELIKKGAQVIDKFKLSVPLTTSFPDFETITISVPEQNETLETFKDLSNKTPYKKELSDLIEGAKNKSKLPVFIVTDDGKKILIKYENSKNPMRLSGPLSQLFVDKSEFEFFKSMSFQFRDNISIINYAAIYCDLISEQYFGDGLTHILRCINLEQSSSGVVSTFDNPIYVPVNKNIISTINIKIADLQGDLIRFNSDFTVVIVTLHFRKIQRNVLS